MLTHILSHAGASSLQVTIRMGYSVVTLQIVELEVIASSQYHTCKFP